VLDTVVQLLWKAVATEFDLVILAIVVVLFVAQLFNWLRVLQMSDLSYSQPITSLSYITVLGFSAAWLGEQIDLLKIAGIVLILAGVWFISRGPHHSNPA
jgi:drug/metabolite transporter (DMT)-like permease